MTTNTIHAMVMTRASQFTAQTIVSTTVTRLNAPFAVLSGRMMTAGSGESERIL